MKKTNTDIINMAHRNKVSDIAFRALDVIQTEPEELQLLSVATLFAALTQRLGLPAGEIHDKAKRIINPEPFDRSGNERYQALCDYAAGILKQHT